VDLGVGADDEHALVARLRRPLVAHQRYGDPVLLEAYEDDRRQPGQIDLALAEHARELLVRERDAGRDPEIDLATEPRREVCEALPDGLGALLPGEREHQRLFSRRPLVFHQGAGHRSPASVP
jgi:hypothetical protein